MPSTSVLVTSPTFRVALLPSSMVTIENSVIDSRASGMLIGDSILKSACSRVAKNAVTSGSSVEPFGPVATTGPDGPTMIVVAPAIGVVGAPPGDAPDELGPPAVVTRIVVGM